MAAIAHPIDANDALDHHARGLALARAGSFNEAARALRIAVALAPHCAEAHANLAGALRDLGEDDDALVHARRAVEIDPDLAVGWLQLARAQLARGRRHDALESLDRALEIDPAFLPARSLRGRERIEAGDFDGAESDLLDVLDQCPEGPEAHAALGGLCADRDEIARAEEHYAIALRAAHDDVMLRVRAAVLLPPMTQSPGEIERSRARLADRLTALDRSGVRLDVSRQGVPTLFYLAYHGRNDRDLHESYGRLLVDSSPPALDPARGARPRVGVMSLHLREHTIGHLFAPMLAGLPRDAVELVIFADRELDDPVTRLLRARADRFEVIGLEVPAARRAIARCGLDVLLYTDLGMDPMTLALAASRLAPAQAATWGHPATTGLLTIDHFLSSTLLDSDDGQGHYTEKLVRLPGLPVRYRRPTLDGAPRPRSAVGLPEGVTLYGCPQSPFKFHPDFDAMLAAILRADPTGRLVLIRSRHEAWTDRLLDRFARSMRDVMNRIVLLPPLSREGFLHLNAAVDVLLDPPHFGGGNTTLEALAMGAPVVTWPSPYLKGRIAAGLYEQMDHRSLVAGSHDEYVEIAARLGRDLDFRREARSEIAVRAEVLFDDEGASHRLARWLGQIARGACVEGSGPGGHLIDQG